jgi:large subunit ribosomal protein L5
MAKPRLYEKYQNEVIPQLMKEMGYNNLHAVPRVEKVVLNMGMGQATKNKAEVERAQEDLTNIAGQKAVITYSRKAIAGFGLSKNYPIGVKVTLRGKQMYEFLDKLFNIILPRTRDFQGLSEVSFDGTGNYSIGLEDQLVFPEIDPNTLDRRRGLQVVIATSTDNDQEGKALLKTMGLPLQKKEE